MSCKCSAYSLPQACSSIGRAWQIRTLGSCANGEAGLSVLNVDEAAAIESVQAENRWFTGHHIARKATLSYYEHFF